MVEASPHRMPWNRGREDHTFPHAGEVCVMDECGRERCVCVPTGNIDGEAMCLLVVDGGTARDSRGPVCRRSAPPEWRRRRNEEGYWNARTHGYDVNTPDHPGAVHHSWWWRAPLVKLDGRNLMMSFFPAWDTYCRVTSEWYPTGNYLVI